MRSFFNSPLSLTTSTWKKRRTPTDSQPTLTATFTEKETILQQVLNNAEAMYMIIAAMSVGIQPKTVVPLVPTEKAVFETNFDVLSPAMMSLFTLLSGRF